MSAIETLAKSLYDARRAVQTVQRPQVSKPDLNRAEAYQVQDRLVQLLDSPVRGYKIGFAKESAGDTEKIRCFGRLLATMEYHIGDTIDRSKFSQLFTENEIAVIIAEDITAPIATLKEFTAKVASVAPGIEMPDKYLKDMAGAVCNDLIASDAIAGAFIVGTPVSLESVQLDQVITHTTFKDTVIDNGAYANVPAAPLESAWWLSGELLRQGSMLRKGDVILTGSTGGAIPVEAGQYHATFGELGAIQFKVS